MVIFMIFALLITFIICVFIVFSTIVVPQQKSYIVERLGKYNNTYNAGLHFIFPFIDKVRSKINLSEEVLDVKPQICITKDNTQVTVDGVLYIQVTDPKVAVYGTNNYKLAVSTLAQTSLRSIIGKMDLDDTVENRDLINSQVVAALDAAAISWGVKLLRYEIRDLAPPHEILKSMQDQITADREKRAKVIMSEAEKIEKINVAQGQRESEIKISEGLAQATINNAEAAKQAKIREAEAHAESIRLIAEAEAESIRTIAQAINSDGGQNAVNIKIAEKYLQEFGKLAKEGTTIITPSNPMDISSMVSTAMSTMSAINNNRHKQE